MQSSTATNLVGQLGIDPVIIQEMLADGYRAMLSLFSISIVRYDPTQNTEWQRFRQQTIGDSDMLTIKDKVRSSVTWILVTMLGLQVEDWRNRRESFGHGMGHREGNARGANQCEEKKRVS